MGRRARIMLPEWRLPELEARRLQGQTCITTLHCLLRLRRILQTAMSFSTAETLSEFRLAPGWTMLAAHIRLTVRRTQLETSSLGRETGMWTPASIKPLSSRNG